MTNYVTRLAHLLVLIPLTALAAETPMITSPTVTREESEQLHAALAVSATNMTEALAQLVAYRTPASSAALDFTIGNLYFEAGDEAAAMTAYRDALVKLPHFRAARVNLARLHLLRDEPDDAMQVLREVTADGQGDADTYLLLGHALLLTDALVSAETAYRQSLMLRPQDPDALLGLARALLPQDRADESLALAAELLRRDPLKREIWALRANAFMALDRTEDAARTLESAHRLALADPEMMATLGDLHLNAGRPEDAVRCYQLAFAGDAPSASRLLRAFEGFVMLRQAEGAAAMRDRVAAVRADWTTPQRQLALRLEGDLALLQDQPEAALAIYQTLLKEDPLDGRTLLRVAELQRATEQLEEAAMTCERAERIPAVQADALLLHAQIEVEREAYRRATELLEAAQALAPRPRVQRYLDQVRRLAALEQR